MKKGLFYTAFTVAGLLLAGCLTPRPQPAPATAQDVPPTLPGEMQQLADSIVTAGGLAALGTDESKSLDLALNMAKRNGRIELSRMVNARIETLAKAFSEETEIPYDSLLLSGFNDTAKVLAAQIAGSIAQALKYDTGGNSYTAYAVMVLDPKAIADQLSKETDLFAKLEPTQAYATLTQEIKAYAAFQAAQK
jgi:hypothetical protein